MVGLISSPNKSAGQIQFKLQGYGEVTDNIHQEYHNEEIQNRKN